MAFMCVCVCLDKTGQKRETTAYPKWENNHFETAKAMPFILTWKVSNISSQIWGQQSRTNALAKELELLQSLDFELLVEPKVRPSLQVRLPNLALPYLAECALS